MTTKEEIKDLEAREIREEPMRIWIYENQIKLEGEFIDQTPIDEQPLDDDIPDFIDNHCNEFNEYCEKIYYEAIQ